MCVSVSLPIPVDSVFYTWLLCSVGVEVTLFCVVVVNV